MQSMYCAYPYHQGVVFNFLCEPLMKKTIFCLLTCVATIGSQGAYALTVNVDAQSLQGTVVTLNAGTYAMSWIGIAGGGQYDAWSYNTATSGNYRNAVSVEANGGATTFDSFIAGNSSYYHNYSTGADALLAFANNKSKVVVSGANAGAVGPATLTLASTQTVRFFVPDSTVGDNKGGVSLDLNLMGAVPEPSSLVMLMLGFAGLAAVSRRKDWRQQGR